MKTPARSSGRGFAAAVACVTAGPLRSALFGGILVLVLQVVPVRAAEKVTPAAGEDLAFTYQDLNFRLPANGWRKITEDTQIGFQRLVAPGQAMTLTVWPVELAPQFWSWSREKHIQGYFEHERNEPRPPNIKWSGFNASERTIGGKKYPALNYKIQGTHAAIGKFEGNGLFLLVFPDDFETRHRFFVFMWQETFAPGKPFAVRDDLHKIVSRLTIGAAPPPKHLPFPDLRPKESK